ncbi:MAG: hypothetical protein R2827_14250 [Bdellovibrionales bacterium]
MKDVERVLYCEAYVVIDPMETDLIEDQVLTEEALSSGFGPTWS